MKPILAYGPGLRSELQAFIKTKRLGANPTIPWESDFLERLEPFATTGKLLRGSVLCFSYETFSKQPPDRAVIKAAMALELTHSALLIHDDVIDADDRRRGQPSLHHQYQLAARHDGLLDSDRFGVNMAICGGDAALFLGFELLSSAQLNRQSDTTFFSLFVEQLLKTCVGQMQDIYFEARPGIPSKKEIYELMKTKTAAYTLALPLAMGAALAGQPAPVLRQLQAIGIAAGTIFQIRDDELGVMGNPRKTGKPVGSDIKEGKKTLIYYYLLKNCNKAERTKLKTIFGNLAATTHDISYAQELVKRRGILELIDSETSHLERQAIRRIDRLNVHHTSKTSLRELVRFCGNRSV